MSFKYLRIEDAGAARIITLHRPERRNALSRQLLIELAEAVSSSGDARAIVIASSGPVFSSGHDLAELSAEDHELVFRECEAFMIGLQALPIPVIAEVSGLATAAGCQLVAACDLAVAATDAAFATPGVRIGLFCTTPMVPLVRAIGRKRAMEMLLTGHPIDAATALAWGLVNRVAPSAQLRACTLGLVEAIAAASRATVATGKGAFYETASERDADAYCKATALMVESAVRPEALEGISAFLGKRRPTWPDAAPVND